MKHDVIQKTYFDLSANEIEDALIEYIKKRVDVPKNFDRYFGWEWNPGEEEVDAVTIVLTQKIVEDVEV